MVLNKNLGGNYNGDFFEDVEVIALFDPVTKWLNKHIKEHNIEHKLFTNLQLSKISLELLNQDYSVTTTEIDSTGVVLKLPKQLFLDFKPSGAVCQMLLTSLDLLVDNKWTHLPLGDHYDAVQSKIMCTNMLSKLDEMNIWKRPCVFFYQYLDETILLQCKEAVLKLGGTICHRESEATHIVYQFEESNSFDYLMNTLQTEDSNHDEIRPIIVAGKGCLLHWRFSSASQQKWTFDVSQSKFPVEPTPSPPITHPWEVDSRWLINSKVFNEWAPEEDYLVKNQTYALSKGYSIIKPRTHYASSQLFASSDGSKKGTKRQRLSSPDPSNKKLKTDVKKEKKKDKSISNRSTGTKKKKNKDEGPFDVTLELPNPPQANAVTLVDMDDPVVSVMSQSWFRSTYCRNQHMQSAETRTVFACMDRETKLGASTMSNTKPPPYDRSSNADLHLLMPARSAWFNYSRVHQMERQSLPEFFSSSFKVSSADEKAEESELYMAYRNCMIDLYRLKPRESLTFGECRCHLSGNITNLYRLYAFLIHWGLINFHQRVPSEAIRPSSLIDSIVLLRPSKTDDDMLCPLWDTDRPQTSKHLLSFDDQEDDKPSHSDLSHPLPHQEAMLKCSVIPPPSGVSRTSLPPSNINEWSQQETLALLKAVERYGDDWNRVSEHVGLRTEEECILQMLRLPILDPYLNGDANVMSGHISTSEDTIPFAQSGNPVMAMVSFLASVFSERVAGNAAKSALREYCKILPKANKLFSGSNKTDHSKADANAKQLPDEKTAPDSESTPTANVEDPCTSITVSDESSVIQPNSLDQDKIPETNSSDVNKDLESNCQKDVVPNQSDTHQNSLDSKETPSNSKADVLSNQTGSVDGFETDGNKSAGLTDTERYTVVLNSAMESAKEKAVHLAGVEERKIRVLILQLIDAQTKKIEVKMKSIQEIEAVLQREHNLVLQKRDQILAERKAFHLELLANMESNETVKIEEPVSNNPIQPVDHLKDRSYN